MGKTTTKAKKTDGKIENPPDCKTKGQCPCNTFERCKKRRPYGSDIWSDTKNRKSAMGFIAFDGEEGIADKKKLNDLWEKFIKRNKGIIAYNNSHEKKIKFNKFFASIRLAGGGKKKALVLPKLSEPYINRQMNQLRQSLYNTAYFTDFQRSMVARANLVRNGLTLRSEQYCTREKDYNFPPKQLLPYAKGQREQMWSVDHIQIRSKGGCNRFCNAAVLMYSDNRTRNDNGPGCPCIDAVKNNEKKPKREKVQPPSDESDKEPRYQLFVCVTYHRNQIAGEGPGELPGTCHANKPCNLDDPRKCKEALRQDVVKPVYK